MWTNQGCRDGSNCLLYKHEDLSSIPQNPGKKLRMAASACDSSPGETETGESCLPATLSYELQVFWATLSQKTRRARLMTQALRAFAFPSRTQVRFPVPRLGSLRTWVWSPQLTWKKERADSCSGPPTSMCTVAHTDTHMYTRTHSRTRTHLCVHAQVHIINECNF